MSKLRLFGKFSKVTPQEDGTLVVEGVASSESVDSQGEVVKAEAMRLAIPNFMKFGNIREMHRPIAAGKAIDITVGEDGITRLSAHVVDSESCKKVSAGVLQGFSIGGNVPAGGRNKEASHIIEQLELTEISLVDRPANPDALITLIKIDAEPPPAPAEDAGKAAAAAPTPAPAATPLKKGLYAVGRAAELLGALAGLAQDTAWEAEYEGDNSAIPGQLRAQVDALAATLRALVAEETAELQAAIAPPAEPIAAAAPTGEVTKAAEPTPAPQPTLQALVESPEFSAALRKALLAPAAEELAKAEAATAAAGEALKKVLAERDALVAELAKARAELSKKPLRAVAVSKADDTGAPPADDGPPPPPEGTQARAIYELKKVHATGFRRLA